MSNTIADDLQLTRVLDNAIVGFKAALLPLGLFSRAISRDPLAAGNNADNSITVPVYAYTSGDAQNRNPGEAYSSKVSNTSTGARKLSINKEKVVGISFTNEEAQNQVAFDPVMHGLIKGRDLAATVIADIASRMRYGYFNGDTLAPMAASSFDVNDVAELGQKAMEAYWPQAPMPGLVLNPAFHFQLVKQSPVLDASQSGSADALRQARINQIMGFQEVGTPAVPLNNDSVGTTFTATAATNVCASTAHGLQNGDQVLVSSTTTLPAGLSAATYYYVRDAAANSFKLSATKGGAEVDITDTGTGTHTVKLTTNLVGFAGAPEAIITGFRPVMPTAGIRQKLVAFEVVDDAESGLTIEYRHIANEDTGVEYQVIGCHYGYEYGLAEALKLISRTAA